MANILIRKLTARHTSLQNFRYYDILVHIFVVVLLISNLIGPKICAIGPLRVSGAQLLFLSDAAEDRGTDMAIKLDAVTA